jgi:hypothetical protein
MLENSIELNEIETVPDVRERKGRLQVHERYAFMAAKPRRELGHHILIDIDADEMGIRKALEQHLDGMSQPTTKIEDLPMPVARHVDEPVEHMRGAEPDEAIALQLKGGPRVRVHQKE